MALSRPFQGRLAMALSRPFQGRLAMALSRPFQGRLSSACSFHASLLHSIYDVMPLALCPQVVSQALQHFGPSEMQAF